MAVVVDASALAAVAFNEPGGGSVTAALAGHALYAPTLIDYELASIGWKKLRRHPDRSESILANVTRTRSLAIARVSPAFSAVLALARLLDITPYDASYVWVARAMGVPLVTLDQRLARAAQRGT
ncbi:MAG: type II toxin-antitoxin system VapC family toxin [Vicinamibacterales bacterium]